MSLRLAKVITTAVGIVWASVPFVSVIDMLIHFWGGNTIIDWTWIRVMIAMTFTALVGSIVIGMIALVVKAEQEQRLRRATDG